MNEYEDALKTINNEILYLYGEETIGEYESNSIDVGEAIIKLKELVSKETPKKPIDVEFGPCFDSMLCCPTCKHGVVPIPAYHGNKYYPRCPFCGQALRQGERE